MVRHPDRCAVEGDGVPQPGEEGVAEAVAEGVGEVGEGAVLRVPGDVRVGDAEEVGRLVGLQPPVDDRADLVVGQHLDLHRRAPLLLEGGGELLEGGDLLVLPHVVRVTEPESLPVDGTAAAVSPSPPDEQAATARPAPASPAPARKERRVSEVMSVSRGRSRLGQAAARPRGAGEEHVALPIMCDGTDSRTAERPPR